MTFLMRKMPNVLYNGVESKNLMVRVGVIKRVLSKFDLFYDYEIHDGERPDTIAHDYYGNSSYYWLVTIPNNVYDMSYDWPLNAYDFHRALMKKYGNVYELQSKPSYYKYVGLPHEPKEEVERNTLRMCPFTFQNLPDVDKSKWKMVSVYEKENDDNESKRNIKLVTNDILPYITSEIEGLMDNAKT